MPRSTVKVSSSTSKGETSARSTSQRSFLEEKTKRARKRKSNLSFKPPKANSKKTKGPRTSQNTSKRKENQNEINNSLLSEAEETNTLHQTRISMSSQGNSSSEISNLTGPQMSSANMEKHTIYEEGLADKDFIQQQILLLSTPFTLQDCPELIHSQGNRERKGHIPQDVIHDSLRKLNHRMNDEIQKYLNRQCQRKVMDDLLDVEKEISENNKQDGRAKTTINLTMDIPEILRACPKEWHVEEEEDYLLRQYSSILKELKKTDAELKETKEKIISSKFNSHLILDVECLAKESTQDPLHEEMVRSNQLVNQIVKVLHMQANRT